MTETMLGKNIWRELIYTAVSHWDELHFLFTFEELFLLPPLFTVYVLNKHPT